MKLDTLLNKFEKMTKGYEKLSGEKIPAGYYSSCTTAIQEAYEQGLLTKLKAILKRNQDPTFGTYDYDGIAVEVMRLVGDITEAKYLASARKAKQQKQVIKLVTKK